MAPGIVFESGAPILPPSQSRKIFFSRIEPEMQPVVEVVSSKKIQSHPHNCKINKTPCGFEAQN
jgi:hypothetical protein